MKTAKEYLLQDFDHTVLSAEHLDVLESLIAAVQREAIGACITTLHERPEDDGLTYETAVSLLRAMLPKETTL
jgi:hypothetical protein